MAIKNDAIDILISERRKVYFFIFFLNEDTFRENECHSNFASNLKITTQMCILFYDTKIVGNVNFIMFDLMRHTKNFNNSHTNTRSIG
jgi:hypothetical protein